MPEGAVHEDDEFVFLKADIGFAWQWFLWGSESDAGMPQGFLQEFFGFGVFALDHRHVEGTGLRGIEAVFFTELRNRCFGTYVGFGFQGVGAD